MNPNHAFESRGHRAHGLRGEETHGGEERQSHQQSSERQRLRHPAFPSSEPGPPRAADANASSPWEAAWRRAARARAGAPANGLGRALNSRYA